MSSGENWAESPGADRADGAEEQPTSEASGAFTENETLRRLRAELGDDAAVDHFVADFLDLLDDRLRTLAQLLEQQRLEDSITALLTIETSGVMVGAQALAETAARLRAAVGERRLSAYAGLQAELERAAEQTKRELSAPS